MVDEETIYRKDSIDWSEFESPYFKVPEEPTDIVFGSWTTASRDINGKAVRGILTTIYEMNKERVKKEFFITSRRLIQEIRPLIQEAEKEGKDKVAVRLYRTGTGFNTSYTVRPL